MCILQYCHFTIKHTEMRSNLMFLYKTVALTHTLYMGAFISVSILFKNIVLLHISVYFIVKWENYKLHIRTLFLRAVYYPVMGR